MYTVVASKPSIHVYKIRDRAGNERIVHRNLLLQVNFLPLLEPEMASTDREVADVLACSVPSRMSVARSGGLTEQTRSVESFYNAEIESAGNADDGQNEAEELSHADSMSNISIVATCGDARTSSWVHSQLSNQEEPNAQVDVSVTDDDTVAVAGAIHSPQIPVSASEPFRQDPVADLDTDDRYTTRLGRVIRPVRRLIESMVQLETLLGMESVSPVIHV